MLFHAVRVSFLVLLESFSRLNGELVLQVGWEGETGSWLFPAALESLWAGKQLINGMGGIKSYLQIIQIIYRIETILRHLG